MEGGIALGGKSEGLEAQFTWTAFLCCLTAASGGALFGYDNGTLGLRKAFLPVKV